VPPERWSYVLHIYIYICIHMYTYVYIYIYIHIYIYISLVWLARVPDKPMFRFNYQLYVQWDNSHLQHSCNFWYHLKMTSNKQYMTDWDWTAARDTSDQILYHLLYRWWYLTSSHNCFMSNENSHILVPHIFGLLEDVLQRHIVSWG